MTSLVDGSGAFRLTPDVVVETFDDETIAVNLAAGRYYSLDPLGGEVLARLTSGRPWDAVVAHFEREYDAAEPPVATTLAEFAEQLVGEGLVEPIDADAGAVDRDDTPVGVSGAASGAAFAPSITVFSDMQDLLPLDPIHEVDATGWPSRADDA